MCTLTSCWSLTVMFHDYHFFRLKFCWQVVALVERQQIRHRVMLGRKNKFPHACLKIFRASRNSNPVLFVLTNFGLWFVCISIFKLEACFILKLGRPVRLPLHVWIRCVTPLGRSRQLCCGESCRLVHCERGWLQRWRHWRYTSIINYLSYQPTSQWVACNSMVNLPHLFAN